MANLKMFARVIMIGFFLIISSAAEAGDDDKDEPTAQQVVDEPIVDEPTAQQVADDWSGLEDYQVITKGRKLIQRVNWLADDATELKSGQDSVLIALEVVNTRITDNSSRILKVESRLTQLRLELLQLIEDLDIRIAELEARILELERLEKIAAAERAALEAALAEEARKRKENDDATNELIKHVNLSGVYAGAGVNCGYPIPGITLPCNPTIMFGGAVGHEYGDKGTLELFRGNGTMKRIGGAYEHVTYKIHHNKKGNALDGIIVGHYVGGGVDLYGLGDAFNYKGVEAGAQGGGWLQMKLFSEPKRNIDTYLVFQLGARVGAYGNAKQAAPLLNGHLKMSILRLKRQERPDLLRP